MGKDLEKVPGVIKTEAGLRFSLEFIDSLDDKYLLSGIGIVRYDNGEFNSYYIACIDTQGRWGIVKYNKDKSFNSYYIEETPGIENRYNKDGKLICQYFIDGLMYTKSTDGSKYDCSNKECFRSGNKEYYYIR